MSVRRERLERVAFNGRRLPKMSEAEFEQWMNESGFRTWPR